MKKSIKLKIYIFTLIISILVFGFWFIIFYNDPFIKFAPENTKLYSLININQKISSKNADKIFSLRNISINKILENKIFKKIKSDYIGKISFFVTENNDFYIIMKEKTFKKNVYDIDERILSNFVNNYTNLNISLNKYKIGKYIVFSTNNINNLSLNKYKFFISNYKKLIISKEFGFILNQNIFKIYIDSFYLNNLIKNTTGDFYYNYFSKDYSILNIKIVDDIFKITISNLKVDNNKKNNYITDYLKNNYLVLNDINPSKIIDSFIANYKNKEISSSENLNYLFKNLSEDGFNISDVKKIFSNNSNLYINFKDSDINISKIDSFLILTKLDNFNEYINNISNLEKVFISNNNSEKPVFKNVVLPDGTTAKEEIVKKNTENIKTKNIKKNDTEYIVKYLKYGQHNFYYSMINNDGIIIFSNNEEMISNVYKKVTDYSLILSNLNINILANIKQDKLEIEIK